jgi:hypothetical protein
MVLAVAVVAWAAVAISAMALYSSIRTLSRLRKQDDAVVLSPLKRPASEELSPCESSCQITCQITCQCNAEIRG